MMSILPAQAQYTSAMQSRSLLNMGNIALLRQKLQRARLGYPLTVVGFGGSVTKGALATSYDKCWFSLLGTYLHFQYPRSQLTMINAGLPGTDSTIGLLREERDVLAKKPDIVIVEFGVNDVWYTGREAEMQEHYEGLLRRILLQPQHPAIVLFFVSNNLRWQMQDAQSILGYHYQLPMVSAHDAIWPEIDAGRLTTDEVWVDISHPNDYGHYLYYTFMRYFFAKAMQYPAFYRIQQLTKPYTPNHYERIQVLTTENYTPGCAVWGQSQGLITTAWKTTVDCPITFQVYGTEIMLAYGRGMYLRGQLSVQVDALAPVAYDAYVAEKSYQVVAEEAYKGLPLGWHTVTITPIPGTEGTVAVQVETVAGSY